MLKVAAMARRAGGRARVLALSILAGALLRFIFDFVCFWIVGWKSEIRDIICKSDYVCSRLAR